MRNGETKVVEKIKTHILYSITFIRRRAVNEIMWKNVVRRYRLVTIDNMTQLRKDALWMPDN